MPQRFLRPGIRTSEHWNQASFLSQSLFIAILTLVDDFGRYDGRAMLLHGECFVLRDDVKPVQTATALTELDNRGLIQLYEVDGKKYLQVLHWQERSRSQESKFPPPPGIPLRNPAESYGPQRNPASLALALALAPAPAPAITSSFIVPDAASAALKDRFEKWMDCRRTQGKKPKDWNAMFAEQFEWLSNFSEDVKIEILSQSIRNNYQGLFEPKGHNGTHQRTPTESRRNIGTSNEGKSAQYRGVGRI